MDEVNVKETRFPWQAWAWRGQTPWHEPESWRRLAGLTVVVPVQGSVAHLRLCLEALRRHSEDPLEIIVINDGAGPEVGDYLSHQSDLQVVTQAEPAGFAVACNQGARMASRPVVCFLGPEVLVTPAWDRLLLRPFVGGPPYLAVGPRACNVAGRQAAPAPLPYQTLEELADFARRWTAERLGQWEESDRLAEVAMAVRRAEFLALGGFPEDGGTPSATMATWSGRVRAAGGTLLVTHDCYVHRFEPRVASPAAAKAG